MRTSQTVDQACFLSYANWKLHSGDDVELFSDSYIGFCECDVHFSERCLGWRWQIRSFLDSPPRELAGESLGLQILHYKRHPPSAFLREPGRGIFVGICHTRSEFDRIGTKNIPGDAILVIETPATVDTANADEWMFVSATDRVYANPESRENVFAREDYKTSFVVGFADGIVWELSMSTPKELVALFFSLENAEKYDRDLVLGPHRLR